MAKETMTPAQLEEIRLWEAYHKAVKKHIRDLKDYYKSDVTVQSGNPPTPPPPPPGPR